MSEAAIPFPPDDPYAPKPTFWQRHPHLGWALAVAACTAILTYAMFPPVATGDAAFAFAIPAVLWAYRRPPFKIFVFSVLGAQMVAWTALLGWLHNVTWAGLFLLGPFIGALIGLWHLALWWALRENTTRQTGVRIFAMLALAALWVMLEWLRTWIFDGFPWLPLAASQWQRPFMLQVAAYAGAWAVSFVLICFNLGAAAYAHRVFFEGQHGLRKRSPEFNIALLVLMGATFPFLADIFGQRQRPLLKAAFVQPYIPQGQKWDEAMATETLATIQKTTFAANDRGAPEAILWPEAVTPWILNRDPNVQTWLESVSHRIGKPMLLGTVYTQGEDWFNGAVVVDPVGGLQPGRYAKRELVPFGEFIPLRPVLGWLEKVVPIGGDFARGTEAEPLTLPVGTRRIRAGVLICYEDIFPRLARENTRAGAEVLTVLTNNGWFGEGGAAYQHAAHSVLRAVENRRPVLRCGNGGWSGWIDEYGRVRDVLTDERNSIYFRGSQTIAVTRDEHWVGRLSYYGEHGDWFLLVCAGLVTGGFYTVVLTRPRAARKSRFAKTGELPPAS